MQIEELRILFALQPDWTVSINGTEFVTLQSSDIELQNSTLRFGRITRKVVEVRWLRPNVVRIVAGSRLNRRSDVIIFYPGTVPSRVDLQRRRRTFERRIMAAAAEHFGRSRPVRDRRRGPGAAYARFMLGARAIIAVDPDESTPIINGIMRAAIQWQALIGYPITVIVPAHRHKTLAARLEAAPALRDAFDWLLWDGSGLSPLDPAESRLETHVHEYRQPAVDAEVARLCAVAPGLLQPVPHIAAGAICIRFRGLEVARVSERGTTFPMGEPLEELIPNLLAARTYGSRDPLSYAHEESWLESNVIAQIQDVIPVRPGCIYPQVPSFAGEDRKIIDLLTVTDAGRLAVVEIKAASDPDLPFQAFDYWLAVERHRKLGDFQSRGYFPGVKLRDEPALLVMVAPLLSFHRTMKRLVSCLPAGVPMLEIGINQSWKRQIKILRRSGSLG